MIETQEIIDSIALTRISFYNLTGMLELYRRLGSASEVLSHHAHIRDVLPEASPRLVEAFRDISEPLRRAQIEYEWDMANHVTPLCLADPRYPERLRHCPDAPLVLYYKGSADLNQAKVINIVGTRRCTAYGQDIVRRFLTDLKQRCPQVLVVSGLAYGIDICAHRQALANGYETVGVLAHGLDDLYPPRHRATAEEMTRQGGLLTEFMTNTNADKMNFVRRNRIVAGLCDATLLVESAPKGGGLITCEIAQGYGRDVFAFPGPVGAESSRGCNNLIRDNGAALISDAADFVHAMGWDDDCQRLSARQTGIERQLFPQLSAEEQRVVDALRANNDLQINLLTVKTALPVPTLTATLFSLEMKGVVRSLAGGIYHLIN